MTNEEIIEELEAILIYCKAIRRENNRGIIKLLVRDEYDIRKQKTFLDIESRVKKILRSLK